MVFIVVFAATLSYWPPHSETTVLILYFIGAQCILSYLAAGLAKLNSQTWRSGAALRAVTGTEAYGVPSFNRFLQSHPVLGQMLTWATLAFEVLAPLMVFVWQYGGLALVIFGTSFHISSAAIMGLNSFPLSFASTYPAVLFISDQVHNTDQLGIFLPVIS
jgi:hypothetical protein